jgi:membrane dipeptidase
LDAASSETRLTLAVISCRLSIETMKRVFVFYLLLLPVANIAQSYKRLHKKAIVVDTHNDVLGAAVMRGMHLEEDLAGRVHSDFRRFKEGGVDVQVFAVSCGDTFGKDTAFKFANIEIDSLYAIARRNSDHFVVVQNPKELLGVVKQKKLAGIIGVEGGHMIEDSLYYPDSLFIRGARYLTLTWNNSTSWATSAQDEWDSSIKRSKELNEFGRSIVRRMNELGMMIDVSHAGEQTFWDVIATTTKPIIASHSSVYTLSPQFRNLKDEQIKAIAKNGGVVQLAFGPWFLDSNYNHKFQSYLVKHKEEVDSLVKLKWSSSSIGNLFRKKYADELKAILPPLSLLLDHIDYVVHLVGVDYVGLGSDFDGMPYSPLELEDVSKYPYITKGLLERGYSKTEVNKILGGNFIRVFKSNMY